MLSLIIGSLLASSLFSSRSRYYLRMISFVFGLFVGSLTGVVSGIIVSLVNPDWRKNIQWLVARTFYGLVSPLIGWEFIVEGEEYLNGCYNGESNVLVGNHQSMIDIFYLGRIFPKTCVVMSKKEIKYVPLLGQFMSLSKAVFVDRHNRLTAMETFKQVGLDMKKHGLNLFIFPEGTRSNAQTPTLLPFKKGAFHLSLQSGLPIIPIICETYSTIYSSKSHRFEPGKLILKVLEPIKTSGVKEFEGKEGVDRLCELVRTRMLDGLIELSQRDGSVSSRCLKRSGS
ncbi:uncharacterized protein MELLADRAFT_56751 [Melampsora larici-populina 98AG31]|uniref:1-acyl-sn-glycerol-3-phosphate acyltransferase n=1 Tax=Melampsora larici-populina (strain 98AG31 / pathotype 3-4-7) TaxID=747676 RepID=F4RU25_MELLP|nr:uncharacterized protein MELLADRAFT_56751 [Melampsora larici-populina 98AG31]EGG04156.1 hypothetical protein MELLADRAFT_56751 [Melampsora larici-populina 98AG31]